MKEYINLNLENIDDEHICCAIGDPKHQKGVHQKKEWLKKKFDDGLVFRKFNARGKIFIQYEQHRNQRGTLKTAANGILS